MKFLNLLSRWTWLDIVVLSAIIVTDNVIMRDGLWVSLIIAVSLTINPIMNEMQYLYSRPVNHPDQTITDKDIRGNLIHAILSLGICIAPLIYGTTYVQILAVFSGSICAYATVAAYRLFSFTRNDVKYED